MVLSAYWARDVVVNSREGAGWRGRVNAKEMVDGVLTRSERVMMFLTSTLDIVVGVIVRSLLGNCYSYE